MFYFTCNHGLRALPQTAQLKGRERRKGKGRNRRGGRAKGTKETGGGKGKWKFKIYRCETPCMLMRAVVLQGVSIACICKHCTPPRHETHISSAPTWV